MKRRVFFAALGASLVLGAAPALAAGGGSSSGGDASREQQRLTSADSYLPLPTFSNGVVSHGRVRGTLVVDVGVDVPDASLRARVNSMQPRLRDALRTALSTYSTAYYRAGAAPDPATLARIMQGAVDRTLGASGARLLLVNLIYQSRPGG